VLSGGQPRYTLPLMRRLMIIALLLVIALPGYAHEPKVRHDMLVTAGWLESHLGDRPGAVATFFGKKEIVVLQVGRDRKAYDAGHVPGAQFVALGELAVKRNGVPNELPDDTALVETVRRLGLDRHKRIILYDDADGLLAARAWFTLDYLGLGTRAALLDGGWKKWRAEGRPDSTEVPPPRKPTSYKLRMPNDVVVLLPEVQEISHALLKGDRQRVALVDARPEDDFTGAKAGEVARPGHIPGAEDVYWKEALVSADNPVLRPPAELRALFEAAGAGAKKTNVTYCYSGVQGAFDYFLLRYLGYDARLYDGSFSEWSAARQTMVEKGK